MIENIIVDDATLSALAHDIVAVHGTGAAAIARQNARSAALAGQPAQAKSWLAVVGSVQRLRAEKYPKIASLGHAP